MNLQIGTDVCRISIGSVTYDYPVVRDIDYCALLQNELVPDWIPVFDVRSSEAAVTPKADYGAYLHSSDRPSYLLGLQSGWAHTQNNDLPVCTFTPGHDLRDDQHAFQYVLDEVVERAVELRERFLKGEGFLPVFLWVGNYAGGVIADRRVKASASLSQTTP